MLDASTYSQLFFFFINVKAVSKRRDMDGGEIVLHIIDLICTSRLLCESTFTVIVPFTTKMKKEKKKKEKKERKKESGRIMLKEC